MAHKGMKAPAAFEVEQRGVGYCVSWSNDEFDFHVWLDPAHAPSGGWGTGDPTLYKNRKATRSERGHKTVRMALANHPAVAAAIGLIPDDVFKAATARHAALEEAEANDRRQQAIYDLADRAERLGFRLVPIDQAQAAE